MELSTYQKAPLTHAQHISQSQQRGLQFSDQAKSEMHLKTIGYYRLSAYFFPFIDRSSQNRNHGFIADTHFQQILDLYIDLLFYHARLHCYVVIELKLGTSLKTKREPEYAGKLNFYINAIDKQLCKKGDAPTIGILRCKSKDKWVAEYALNGINNPMGVSEHPLTQALPDELQGNLPSIALLEQSGAEHE